MPRTSVIQRLKKSALPAGLHARTLPVGIARGIRMDIDFAREARLYCGLYELELNRHLRRLCSPGVKAFDVGGQYGYDALLFAKRTAAPVISFECDAAACARMLHTVQLNPRLAALIRVVPAMVGTGRDGTVSLDDYAAESFEPDLIKIDVEGGELDVLTGAMGLLENAFPALVVEVHSADLERRCGRLMVERGYRPTVVHQRIVMSDHRPTQEVNRWLVADGRTRTRLGPAWAQRV